MKLSSFAPSVAPSVVTASAPRATASSAPSPASQARSGVLTVGYQTLDPIEFWRACIGVFGNVEAAKRAIFKELGKTAKARLRGKKNSLAKKNQLDDKTSADIYLGILRTYAKDNRFQLQLLPNKNTLVRRPLGQTSPRRR
jgi:hypothetical protein